MIRDMKRFLKLDFVTLVLSALGALILSAHNTYQVMQASGQFVALGAVLALEIGLVGLVAFIEDGERGQYEKPFIQWLFTVWYYITDHAAPVLIILLLIATNTLNNVDVLGLGVSDKVLDWTRLVVFGAFIPFLALVTLHRARSAFRKYTEEEKPKVSAPKPAPQPKPAKKSRLSTTDRRKLIREMLERGEQINQTKLARQTGFTRITIARDVKVIEEELAENDF